MMLHEANNRLKKVQITEEQLWQINSLYCILNLDKDDFCKIVDLVGIDKLIQQQGRYERFDKAEQELRVRWFSFLPYVWRVFIQKLIALCGENNFTATKQFDFYQIDLDVNLELFGQVEELERLIETMIPCNMIVTANNKILCPASGLALVAGGAFATEFYIITDEGIGNFITSATAFHGGGVVYMESITITDN